MTGDDANRRIEEAFNTPGRIQAAIARGIADARRQYAQAGHPMATWRNGQVVWVDALTGVEVPKPSKNDLRN
jgi:hypothetical protein